MKKPTHNVSSNATGDELETLAKALRRERWHKPEAIHANALLQRCTWAQINQMVKDAHAYLRAKGVSTPKPHYDRGSLVQYLEHVGDPKAPVPLVVSDLLVMLEAYFSVWGVKFDGESTKSRLRPLNLDITADDKAARAALASWRD